MSEMTYTYDGTKRVKGYYWKGFLAGAFIALIASVLVSQAFKPGLLELPWLVAWYLLSFIIGGIAGFAGVFLVNMIPVRMISAVYYIVGALFGAFAFYMQFWLFLLYMFKNNPTSF